MNGISDYPPNFLNFKRGSIGSISFSDAMCSEVTRLKCLDILFLPVGGSQYVQKSLPQDNQSEIIIRSLGMNRIQRIQIFLQDYNLLNPHLKNLLKDSREYYQKELLNEYLKVSRHPYQNEYLSIT